VKLPLVLLVTCGFTLLFNGLVGKLLGEGLGLREVTRVTLSAMGVAAVLLASLAPVVLLFHLTLPLPSPTERLTHNLLYLLHTVSVGGCGLVGTLSLFQVLRRRCRSPLAARRIAIAWVVCLAVVGGEVAWAFRPFLGSVYEPVAFLREDALEGNVYELIWTDILPFLAHGAPGEPSQGESP
jgi:hypothetical protein